MNKVDLKPFFDWVRQVNAQTPTSEAEFSVWRVLHWALEVLVNKSPSSPETAIRLLAVLDGTSDDLTQQRARALDRLDAGIALYQNFSRDPEELDEALLRRALRVITKGTIDGLRRIDARFGSIEQHYLQPLLLSTVPYQGGSRAKPGSRDLIARLCQQTGALEKSGKQDFTRARQALNDDQVRSALRVAADFLFVVPNRDAAPQWLGLKRRLEDLDPSFEALTESDVAMSASAVAGKDKADMTTSATFLAGLALRCGALGQPELPQELQAQRKAFEEAAAALVGTIVAKASSPSYLRRIEAPELSETCRLLSQSAS